LVFYDFFESVMKCLCRCNLCFRD